MPRSRALVVRRNEHGDPRRQGRGQHPSPQLMAVAESDTAQLDGGAHVQADLGHHREHDDAEDGSRRWRRRSGSSRHPRPARCGNGVEHLPGHVLRVGVLVAQVDPEGHDACGPHRNQRPAGLLTDVPRAVTQEAADLSGQALRTDLAGGRGCGGAYSRVLVVQPIQELGGVVEPRRDGPRRDRSASRIVGPRGDVGCQARAVGQVCSQRPRGPSRRRRRRRFRDRPGGPGRCGHRRGAARSALRT